MTLILATIALLLGPLIYAAGHRNRLLRRTLDVLIVLTIAAIIIVDIVPEALRHGGSLAILVLVLGVAFPVVLERLFHKATDAAHLVIVALAALGLLIHAVVDGFALLPETGRGLAHAVILHRLPVGMALWWAVRPNFGIPITAAVFASVILATTAGYLVGESILELAEVRTIALLQAFVAGSLIHVVAFGVKHKH